MGEMMEMLDGASSQIIQVIYLLQEEQVAAISPHRHYQEHIIRLLMVVLVMHLY